ncbi:hypothetical protein FNV43_RR08383 [Rhamnella rubrinervis]|uniref:TIR domain-containing protein n=1 Tax=Rhamnella rubrinervis TaxID=2594499 RepID=A0A8K0MJA2_9ROSA|nr:hypothetical protein FNV43_RR08383 [Rhamnella rubrinervis]
METNPSSSSFSSSSSPAKKHDVFLSFRCDTRYNFISQLDSALRKSGLFSIFKDESKLPKGKDRLQKGKDIEKQLMKAIEDSHYAVVVISEKYADSDWCLKEVAKIVECMGNSGRIRTIFYHVNLSDVRDVVSSDVERQRDNNFWKALDQHAKNQAKDPSRFEYSESWRSALVQVSYEYADYVKRDTDEAVFIKNFVADISSKLGASIRTIEALFGMVPRIKKLDSYVLDYSTANEVCFIGKHVCEKQANGLVDLQTKLLKDILGEDFQVGFVKNGINLIRSRLHAMKVFIVLDDVNKSEQLEALADSPKKKQGPKNELDIWFGPGSVIIVTTRDENLLTERYEKYRVEYLDDNEALQLFSWNAFKSIEPPEEFKELSKEVVKYASNLPLALTVLGSLFRPIKKYLWESVLSRLRKCPEKDIVGKLKISYDNLDEVDQCIFLDIACFFKGYPKTNVIRILDGCEFNSEYGISNLIAKSLLRITEHDMIWMHDLLEETAKDIVRKKSRNELARQSRIWDKDDLYQILVNKEGTNEIEAIITHVDETKECSLEALSSMKKKKLRILEISTYNRIDFGGPEVDFDDCVGPELSNNLRCLRWNKFPYSKFPSSFQPQKLVQLNLWHSNIKQLWNNFAVVPNLQILYLLNCHKLSEIDPSIIHLKRLIILNLQFCRSLKKLPEEINCLASLQRLSITACSKIEKLPDNLEQLKNLTNLDIDRSGTKHLPSSIFFMEKLEFIRCGEEMKKSAVRENIISYRTTSKWLLRFGSDVRELDLIDCNLTGPEAFPEYFCKLASLEYLDLSKNPFSVLPPGINGLSSLRCLRLEHCKNLRSSSSLEEVYVNYCTSLASFLDPLKPCHLSCSTYCLDCTELVRGQDGKMTALASLLRFLEDPHKRRGNLDFRFVVPQRDNKLPFWFINQSSTGSISIKLDPNWRSTELIGVAMVVCFPANSSTEDNFSCNIRICGSENWETTMEMGVIGSRMSGHLSLLYRSCNDTLERIKQLEPQSCDTLEFSFLSSDDEHSVSCGPCGVRLVYEGDIEDLEDITSIYINDHKDVQSSHSQRTRSSTAVNEEMEQMRQRISILEQTLEAVRTQLNVVEANNHSTQTSNGLQHI